MGETLYLKSPQTNRHLWFISTSVVAPGNCSSVLPACMLTPLICIIIKCTQEYIFIERERERERGVCVCGVWGGGREEGGELVSEVGFLYSTLLSNDLICGYSCICSSACTSHSTG